MLLISYNGPQDPLDYAFYDSLDQEFDISVVSASSTQIVVRNPDTGALTTLSGSGFPPNPEVSISGTVTGFITREPGGAVVSSFSGISWSLADLISAIEALMNDDNEAPFTALLNRQDITFDISGARGGFRLEDTFDDVTRPITIVGSDFGERVEGGRGNDTINPGTTSADSGRDVIYASPGNDTVVLSDVLPGFGNVELTYGRENVPVAVTIDGPGNAGSLVSAFGSMTLVDVQKALDWDTDGFEVWGSQAGDSFAVNGGANTWIEVNGGEGADSYDLTLSGIVRLSFRESWLRDATQGVQVNLTTGTIANDGFGNVEAVILRPGGSGFVELQGTRLADALTGSSRNDRFILNGGNDTVVGGGGFDTVRYDRSGYTSGVTVDLAAGTATGDWEGSAFTDSLSGIRAVWGTTNFGDHISGSSQSEYFRGRGGNDTLLGGDGDDSLLGGDGNDLLGGGVGNDFLEGWNGNDTIYGAAGNDTAEGGLGNDVIFGGGTGTNRLLGDDGDDTITTGAGGDLAGGGTGNDVIYGGNGNDTIYGGDGNDFIGGGAGNDQIFGGNGNDVIYLGLGNDFIGGGTGNDVIYGGAGANTIYGGAGNDTVQGGVDGDVIVGGGTGANVLLGNGGNDHITAGAGNDFLAGGDGNDTILGGDGANTIYLGTGDDLAGGGAGNDAIFAGAGANTIYGGTGNDTVVAGTGRDVIVGGPGADTFVFTSAAHAGIGGGRDVITGFQVGVDHIDLSAMNLSFIGGAGFSGTAGELRYQPGFLLGDLDGDGVQDFAIELSGAPALNGGDLLL